MSNGLRVSTVVEMQEQLLYKAIRANVPIFCIDLTRSTPGIDAAGYTLAQVNNTGNFHDDNWYKANNGHNVKMTPALANMWKYILYKDVKQGEKVKWDDFTRESKSQYGCPYTITVFNLLTRIRVR